MALGLMDKKAELEELNESQKKMAEELKNEAVDSVASTDAEFTRTKKKKKKGIFSRLWVALFGKRGDDFGKRLEQIAKEEAVVLARITRRSQSWRKIIRRLVISFLVFEVCAVAYAITNTGSLDLDWKIRALRVLPIFLVPGLCFVTFLGLRSFTRMRERKDNNTLEKLRAERQEKINELKEKTNYYITQQLIQRYDTDPAAKAAAASVLALKMGSDSGLKVHVEDESNLSSPTGNSSDFEVAETTGLRHRKQQPLSRAVSIGSESMKNHEEEMLRHSEFERDDLSQQHPVVVEHHQPTGPNSNDGGWVARLAAFLVAEDPNRSYALVCGNCLMHNGLARKEDYPHITYYCPHCKALNKPKQLADRPSESSSPTLRSSANVDAVAATNPGGPTADKVPILSSSTGEKAHHPDESAKD